MTKTKRLQNKMKAWVSEVSASFDLKQRLICLNKKT